ncbi:MAG: homocysteine S-methyltransferase family protein [Lachnospiraceae bacterium]
MKKIWNENRFVYCDGGTGAILQEMGLQAGELPENWNLEHPDRLIWLHQQYALAGADIINANTFGANGLKFTGKDGSYSVEEIVMAGIFNAKKAVALAGRGADSDHPAYVALDMGPTGKLLKPMGDLEFEKAVDLYAEVVCAGVKAGADCILIETMSDMYELKAAVLAAKENSDLPILATVIFSENGKMLTGGTPESVTALLEGLGVDAIGVNCGLGPDLMIPMVKRMLEVASVPVIVNPNAGLPRSEQGKTVYDVGPEEFADTMLQIADLGARILGGCCGTTPKHIRVLVERTKNKVPKPVNEKYRTVVSSYSQAVEIGRKPIIVGERINPTGKKKFKQALREQNYEYILQEALTQEENGAHVLDVNVGLPEIDEKATMVHAVKEIQAILDVPLQIDTTSKEVMEAALRVYNGKALINSVNGKQEVMEEIFPLVKKYGGVVVALALDEDGIPATAEGRIAIAEKIYKKAEEYGIAKKDILIDALTMTISTDPSSAATTLDTVRHISKEMGGKTILGVSNISFGLPQRENINASFFVMALQAGLSAGIVNPNSLAMMRAYDTFLALSGLDDRFENYLSKYSAPLTPEKIQMVSVTAKPAAGAVDSLGAAIEKGLKEKAAEYTAAMLKETPAMDIINKELIPALDRVGKSFEKGIVFLPQLLMSADCAQTAFEVIKETLQREGHTQTKKGTIVLATVRGDIHDIGKNIVKVLLENYDYNVIDLGKDVPEEKVLEAVLEHHAPLAGLSALMTTTVVNMESTIKLLHEKAPWCKIVVGGAVLTQEYADAIHADKYCKDAMATVNYAEKLHEAGILV